MNRILAFASFVLLSLLNAHAAENPLDTCPRPFADDEIIFQTLFMMQEKKRHHLRVPASYLEDPWDLVQNLEHTSQLFRVTVEDFTPVTRRQSSDRLRTGKRDYFSFVLQDLVPLDELLRIELRLSVPGLARTDPTFNAAPRQYFTESRTESGMTAFTVKRETDVHKNVFAIFDPDGHPTAVLSCTPVGNTKNAVCDHDFRAHGIDIRVGYRRDYLARSAEIQDRVSDFVGCMTVKEQ